MNMHRAGRRWLLGCFVFAAVLLASASPSFAVGCADYNCYHCAGQCYDWGCAEICADNGGDGRLCCEEYSDGNGGTWCRAYDAFCYGVIVRDVQ